MPALRHPVVLDTLTREVYPLNADDRGSLTLPISDYAMVLTDADTLRGWVSDAVYQRLTSDSSACTVGGQYVEE